MDILRDYQSEFMAASEACMSKISTYPVEFQEQAQGFLGKINVFRDEYHGSCFSQMLPFWLEPVFGIEPEVCRQIAVGNLFGFMYFLILDAVMDTPPGQYKADLLPLGNLFMLDFYGQYRKLFPDNPDFWTYLQRYYHEWAESVIGERKGFWLKNSQCAELTGLARKAAPLKITVAACCMLSDQKEAIEPVARAVDTTVVTFQLLDDWADWREDLAVGNCSYFLSQVMRVCKVKEFAALKESHIQQAVFGYNLLERVFCGD